MYFAHLWPWLGLGLAALLLGGLFFGNLRADRALPRYLDITWLAWAATAAYLLHQFEEHGIDARGMPYAFRGALCATFGLTAAAGCPIPEAFITAVNVPLIWLAGPAAALLGRRRPLVALGFTGLLAVNAVAHLGPAVAGGGYNPGLVTAILLFVPLSLWSFRAALRRPDLGISAVAVALLAGILGHAVLLLSLKAYLGGAISETTLVAIQVANPAILLLLLLVASAVLPTRRAA